MTATAIRATEVRNVIVGHSVWSEADGMRSRLPACDATSLPRDLIIAARGAEEAPKPGHACPTALAGNDPGASTHGSPRVSFHHRANGIGSVGRPPHTG